MTTEPLTADEFEHLKAALTAFMPDSDLHTEVSATILRKLREPDPAWRCTICGWIVDLRFEAEFPKPAVQGQKLSNLDPPSPVKLK